MLRPPIHAQRLRHADGRVQAVFVESVKPVRAAEVRAVSSTDFLPARLGANGRQCHQGMEVGHLAQNSAGSDASGGVQGDAVWLRRGQLLQPVHVVGQCDGAIIFARRGNSTRRARWGATGSSVASVCSTVSLRLVVNPSSTLEFLRGCVRQQFHRLRPVACKDDLVEQFRASILVANLHRTGRSRNPSDVDARADVLPVRRGQRRNVLAAAAFNGVPLGMCVDAKKAVVGEEANQRNRRKVFDLFERR